MRVLFNAPQMLADETAWTAAEFFRSLVQLPLSHGHKGLCLIVLVADRTLLRPLEKHVAQILAAERLLLESQIGAEAAQALTALVFFLPSSCASHDCHGGLRRALAYFSTTRRSCATATSCWRASGTASTSWSGSCRGGYGPSSSTRTCRSLGLPMSGVCARATLVGSRRSSTWESSGTMAS